MKKLRAFFYVFKNSAFRPSYYQEVLKAPFSFSLKYFLFLFLALSLITVFFFSGLILTKLAPELNKLKTNLPGYYPADLAIVIKNGEVNTNVAEPYFLPLNPDWFPEDIKEGLKIQPVHNLIVIDTRVEPSEIKKYQTLLLLTKHDLAFWGEDGEIRIRSLEQIKDLTINRTVVKRGWEQITPYFKYIIAGLIVLLFIFVPLGTIAGRFIFLLLASILTWILALILRSRIGKLDYAKALQINLHAVTLPMIITALFQFLGVQPQIPFFQTIILLIFNGIIFSSMRRKS